MKKGIFGKALAVAVMMGCVALGGLTAFGGMAQPALASTQNYTGVPLVVMPVHLDSSLASASSVASIQVPAKMKLIGVSAIARAASGVSDTLTVNVRAGDTPVLAAPLAVSSVSVSEGTISTSTIPDETVLHLDTAVGGTNPAWYDISILLTLIPL